jgi:hypothetical protein
MRARGAAGAMSLDVLVALALAMCLLVTYPRAVAARGADGERPAQPGPRQPTAQSGVGRSCAELEGQRWGLGPLTLGHVVLEVPDLRPEWGDRSPSLCLLHNPDLDHYAAILLLLFQDLEEFRSAKVEAVRQLAGAGFDLCRVDLWGPLATVGVPDAEDLYGLPAEFECQPRVVSGDHGAVAWGTLRA